MAVEDAVDVEVSKAGVDGPAGDFPKLVVVLQYIERESKVGGLSLSEAIVVTDEPVGLGERSVQLLHLLERSLEFSLAVLERRRLRVIRDRSPINKIPDVDNTIHRPSVSKIKELAGPEAHINGMGVQQGSNRPFMKFKSTVFTKEGETRFGRVFGADGKDTELNPYAGDIVKLRLSGPSQARNRPDAVSFFLNAVQVWEKKERDGGSGPFGANPDYVSDDPGFDAAPAPSVTPTAPADTAGSEDIPF